MTTLAAGAAVPFGPLYPAPPYAWRESSGIVVRFRTDLEVLHRLVPRPLEPDAGGAMWLYAAHHKVSDLGEYSEVMLGAHATLGAEAGSFSVVTYLDAIAPLALGREWIGWHKKAARIEVRDVEGSFTVTVERDGSALITASVLLERPVNQQALESANSNGFVLKVIPSPEPGAPPQVLQLVRTTPINVRIHRASAGRATLAFRGSPADPLDTIPITEVLGGIHSVRDFDVSGGVIVHDYSSVHSLAR